MNGLTDSKCDENFKNKNNFNLPKRQRTNAIYSSLESEIDLIEESNNTNCDITWTKKHFVPKIYQFTSKRKRNVWELPNKYPDHPKSSITLNYLYLKSS